MKNLVAIVLLAFGFTIAAFVSAGVAAGHASLLSTDPVENAELTTAPTTVSATFNEAMQQQFAAMTVIGPDGQLWSDGEPRVQGAVITVGVRPLGPSGTYTVNYRATSADGHVVNGSWAFRLTVPGTGTPNPAPAAAPAEPSGGDGIPVWPFYVGAVVAVGAAAVWAVRRRA